MVEQSTYCTTAKVAEHLGVSASWLAKLRMKRSGPPFYKLGARCVLYDLEEVELWFRKHRVSAMSSTPKE